MAAQKENLLSFGNVTSAERNSLRQQALTKRPMLLQAEFSTHQTQQPLRVMKLQQRWQELRERELTAKEHNRQLLQQFDEAQDRLRDMLTLNATMKTIRKEYERYLEENSPRWEQQLKEQTQAAHRRRMGECLRSGQSLKSSPVHPSLSQGLTEKTQNFTASQSHNLSDYKDDSPRLPFMPSSWLTQPQSQVSGLPIRAPYQPQPSSHPPQSVPPPPFFLQPPSFPLPHFASSLAPDWGSLLPHLWPPTAGVAGQPIDSGALCSQPQMEEHLPEGAETLAMKDGARASRSSSSQREGSGGSRRSHLSQELDIKPVRLSSGQAESSESSRESEKATQERRKKKRREERDRSRSSSSGREAPSSQGSSGTSSAVIIAPATVVQSSGSDASSKRSSSRRSRRSGAPAVVSPRVEVGKKEGSKRHTNNLCSDKEVSQSTGKEVESPDEESRSEKSGNQESSPQRKEESGSESESKGSGKKSPGEKGEDEEEPERELGNEDEKNYVEKGNSEINGEREESNEEDSEASEEKSATEDNDGTGAEDEDKTGAEDDDGTGAEDEDGTGAEDEDKTGAEDDDGTGAEDEDDTGAEDEMEEQESVEGKGISKKRVIKMRKQDTEEVDEYGCEGDEDKTEAGEESDEEERGGSGEEKEQGGDEAGEPEQEGDSEDSIIAPKDNRAKKIYVIPEATEQEEQEEEEEEEESKTGSSDDDLNDFSDEDIENLLAPQDQSQKKEEKEKSTGLKPKATCDNVDIFQVEQCRWTKENLSDSDEFDHFYD